MIKKYIPFDEKWLKIIRVVGFIVLVLATIAVAAYVMIWLKTWTDAMVQQSGDALQSCFNTGNCTFVCSPVGCFLPT